MKKISIIVPVYNTKEKYLRECIEALINQTIQKEIEIIIVDDGSKEQCAKICDEYALNYQNIQVIHQNNQGLAISRNNGMKYAKGEWIMFVDSDDWVENDICEKLLKEEKDDVDIIISSANNCYTDKIKPVRMFNGQNREWNNDKNELELNIISGYILKNKDYKSTYLSSAWAKLYRRSFIEKNELEKVCKLKFREDNIFNLYCFEKARNIIYRDYYLYNYRQCKNSLIHKNEWDMIEKYIEYLNEEKKFIIKFNKSDEYYEAHKIRSIESIANIIGQYIFKGNCKYSEKIKKINEIMKNKDFEDAIKNVDTSYLGKYLKTILFFLRRKMYIMVNIVYNIREFVKEREEKNLYE